MLRRWLKSFLKALAHTGSYMNLCVVFFCLSQSALAADEIQNIYGNEDDVSETASKITPAAPIVITVKPHASVTQAQVYLGDIATCGGDVEVCGSISGVVVMPSPEPGRMATISIHDLKSILANELPETPYTLNGQGVTRVISEEQEIDAAMIREELQKKIGEINSNLFQVEIRLGQLQLARKMKLRPGSFNINFPQLRAENVRATDDWVQAQLNGFVRLDVELSHESDGKIQVFPVRVKFELYRQFPVATRSFKKGEMLKKSDFALEARKISSISRTWIESASVVDGHILRGDLGVGEVPRLSQIATAYLVQRGAPVELRIRSRGVAIQGKGKALMRGVKGDQIDVIYDVTKKKLSGKVVGESIVEVTL